MPISTGVDNLSLCLDQGLIFTSPAISTRTNDSIPYALHLSDPTRPNLTTGKPLADKLSQFSPS
jgi:hypothetical protein